MAAEPAAASSGEPAALAEGLAADEPAVALAEAAAVLVTPASRPDVQLSAAKPPKT